MVPGIAGTAWAAFNSVTQYADHEKLVTGTDLTAKYERRFLNNLLPDGVGSKLKDRALVAARVQFLGDKV